MAGNSDESTRDESTADEPTADEPGDEPVPVGGLAEGVTPYV